MNDNEKITVMIVDDHPMVRKGLAMFVGSNDDMKLVAEAANAASAVELYHRERPDIVLMDMIMPDHGGDEATRLIRQDFPAARIIALTSFDDESLITSAIKSGARGFLYKTVSVEELADAIRQVHQGRMILDSRATEVMVNQFKESASPASDFVKPGMSEREKKVLSLLAQGMTNKQVAYQMEIQPSTVKQYLGSIFSKLNVNSRTEAVALALRLGIVDK